MDSLQKSTRFVQCTSGRPGGWDCLVSSILFTLHCNCKAENAWKEQKLTLEAASSPELSKC